MLITNIPDNMENIVEEIIAEAPVEQEPIIVIQLDEDNVVKNFISVLHVDDMPNCIAWQDGVSIGDTYDSENGVFVPAPIVKIVPDSVTMRQGRLALLSLNKLSAVAAAIDSLESPQKEVAQIEWEFSSEIFRNRPLVQILGPALGLTEDELDDLFILASTL